MKIKKKVMATIAALCLCCTAGALVGCNEETTNDNDPQIVAIYNSYVAYAESEGTQPLSYEDWLAQIKGAAGADGLTPHIGENGNWWIGNTDTGVKATGADGAQGATGAQGEQGISGAAGADGITPHIGENGNWWIGDTDTGVKAAGTNGAQGATGAQGAQGIPGTDGVGIEDVSVAIGEDPDGKAAFVFSITYTDGNVETRYAAIPESEDDSEENFPAFSVLELYRNEQIAYIYDEWQSICTDYPYIANNYAEEYQSLLNAIADANTITAIDRLVEQFCNTRDEILNGEGDTSETFFAVNYYPFVAQYSTQEELIELLTTEGKIVEYNYNDEIVDRYPITEDLINIHSFDSSTIGNTIEVYILVDNENIPIEITVVPDAESVLYMVKEQNSPAIDQLAVFENGYVVHLRNGSFLGCGEYTYLEDTDNVIIFDIGMSMVYELTTEIDELTGASVNVATAYKGEDVIGVFSISEGNSLYSITYTFTVYGTYSQADDYLANIVLTQIITEEGYDNETGETVPTEQIETFEHTSYVWLDMENKTLRMGETYPTTLEIGELNDGVYELTIKEESDDEDEPSESEPITYTINESTPMRWTSLTVDNDGNVVDSSGTSYTYSLLDGTSNVIVFDSNIGITFVYELTTETDSETGKTVYVAKAYTSDQIIGRFMLSGDTSITFTVYGEYDGADYYITNLYYSTGDTLTATNMWLDIDGKVLRMGENENQGQVFTIGEENDGVYELTMT
ncbi:MAG: hypothetical protein ACI4L9_00665 [Candidatus Coproplasma sp.]